MRISPLPILMACLAISLPAQDTADAFFGLDKIWDIDLVVQREDWTQMFPGPRSARTANQMRFFGEFPYRTGDVTIGSFTAKGIGVRMKGNSSFGATAGTLKRSLKLDFNRHDPKGNFLGLTKLNLHCNALDGTQIKEAVSYQIYRDAGIVAVRTCFARVFLTIPGEVERTYIGLYTVVEQLDGRFMKRELGGGLIMKPEGKTLAYCGEEWNDEYTRLYTPKSTVTDDLARPLIATAKLYKDDDDEAFAKGLEAVTDVDQFLRYTAVTTVIVNGDSPVTFDDNYYLVVPNKPKKVMWLPWDLNWSMGGFNQAMRAPAEDLAIMQPSAKKTFTRPLAVPRFAKRYREIITELMAGPCSARSMLAHIRVAHATVKDALAQEATREKVVTAASEALGGPRGGRMSMFRGRDGDDLAALQAFATARAQSVNDQLAGRSKGRAPRSRSGGSRRETVPGFQVRDVLGGTGALDPAKAPFSKEDLDVAIAAAFKLTDADGSAAVNRDELTVVLRRFLKASRGSDRIGETDLASFRSRRALSLLDGDDDGAVTASEWKAGIEKLLPKWDKDKNGAWSRKELNVVSLE